MAAGIVVFDEIPKSCSKCDMAINKSIPLEVAYVCGHCNKWVIDKEVNTRPEWCPIKEVPEKKEVNTKGSEVQACFALGYNSCIDDVMKGSNKK